jgi:sugar/nucleoside kinase (ribokinase family)
MKKLLLLCLALCVMFMLVGVTFAADSTTVNGYVSDSKCGAKNAACTKKCLAAGAKMVVVTDGDQKVLMVDNPDALTPHIGHHVAVTGTVTGDTIHVDSVKMLTASSM